MVTQEDIQQEIEEISRDLAAFVAARDVIQVRINELEGSPRWKRFIQWSALQVVWHGLVLCTAKCEGLIEDYRAHLERRDNVVPLERKTL
jgi:hypothetical protein